MTTTLPSGGRWRARLRFLGSWLAAIGLLAFALPQAVNVSWRGVLPVLGAIHWPGVLALTVVWCLGLYVHSFVLTAAAPSLTRRRALTLNVTGSAVANVVPLGGAAGVELNRRMMRAWGVDTRSFTGYTFLTNLWDVGAKLLLPVVGVLVLSQAGLVIPGQVRSAALIAGVGFVGVVAAAAALLGSERVAVSMGRALEAVLAKIPGLRQRKWQVTKALVEVRRECAALVSDGWLRMSVGIIGYLLLQWALLLLCLHATGAQVSWPAALAGFAVERLLTVVPITPGGIGVADLGLVAVLLALGGDPVGVAGAALLFRLFIFVVEIPVGGGAIGLWLLAQRYGAQRTRLPATRTGERRIAHVSDVFLPRLGGIETHVDDLARQQRSRGIAADVLTATRSKPRGSAQEWTEDPPWVRRLPAAAAKAAITDYDVVHAHVSMWSPYTVGVARAAMKAGIPVLITGHSMWNGAGGLLRLAAHAGLRRWPVQWSAVSEAAARSFRRSLAGPEVAVLPNAIDVRSWLPGPEAASDELTLVSVMRLMPRKRPLQLVRMFAEVRALAPRPVRLEIIGDGPLRARLEREIARLGLVDAVTVTGRLPREQVLGHLTGAAMYVAPAPKESFGLAALEARCAGLPIVAFRGSGVTEFVRDRREGMLVDSDAEFTVAMAELVTNPDLLATMRAHNRGSLPAMDWSDALARTEELYAAARTRILVADPAGPLAEPAWSVH